MFFDRKMKKNVGFCIENIFWLYILKKGSYGRLNMIFEKYILSDQIYILSAKMNKKRGFGQKNEGKCGFVH